MLKLKKKLVKSGSGIAFSIPKVFLREGLLKEGVEYEISIEEVGNEQYSDNIERKKISTKDLMGTTLFMQK